MSRRKQTAYDRGCTYARGRYRLIMAMGGACVKCGETNHLELEFHHIFRRTWVAKDTSRWVRLARYRREWAAGELLLLCGQCNKKDGWLRTFRGRVETDVPVELAGTVEDQIPY